MDTIDSVRSATGFGSQMLIFRDSTTYEDPTGKTRTWEHAERPTRPKGSEIDGVGIVAILEKPDGMWF